MSQYESCAPATILDAPPDETFGTLKVVIDPLGWILATSGRDASVTHAFSLHPEGDSRQVPAGRHRVLHGATCFIGRADLVATGNREPYSSVCGYG